MTGMVVSVTKGGHLVYHQASGDAVKVDSIFDVASLQKGMITAMILTLVDEGVLALDTPGTTLFATLIVCDSFAALTRSLGLYPVLRELQGTQKRHA